MRHIRAISVALVLLMMVVLGASMTASAASLFINSKGSTATLTASTSSPYTYPSEAFKASVINPFTINVGSAITGNISKIQYVPESTTGTASGADVVFTLSSGTFQAADTGNKYYLYDSGTAARANSASGGAADATVAPSSATTLSTLTFGKIILTKNHVYTILSSGTATNTNLNVATAASTSPTAITLSVSQGILNAGTNSFLQFSNYWRATVDTKATGVIDVAVASGRKKFSTSAGHSATTEKIVLTFNPDTTDTATSKAKGFVDTISGSTLAAALVNGVVFSSVLAAVNVNDITGISTTTPVTVDTGAGPQTLTYDATNKRYSTTLATASQPTPGQTFTFLITVDGVTVLNTRSFSATALANGAAGFPTSTTYLDKSDAGSWTLNGYQALCPYVNTNLAFGTQFILNNNSTTAVDVFWDTVTSSSPIVQAALANFSNKQVTQTTPSKAQILPGATLIFNADDVVNALGLKDVDGAGVPSRNQIRVTVAAPPSQVTGMAIQADGGVTKRSEPLLIDNNISGTGGTTSNQGYKTN